MQFASVSRMHRGVFWRYFTSLALLSVAAIAVLTWLFANAYEGLLWRQVEEELRTSALSLAQMFTDRWPEAPAEDVQSRVAAIGRRAGIRLTLIAMDGKVLADSYEQSAAAVAEMESHRGRQEVAAALRSGAGRARRLSPSQDEPFLFYAVRVDVDGVPRGVVRTAQPVAPTVDEIAAVNRWLEAIAVVLALGCAAVAYALAWRLAAPLQELADSAAALASGRYDRRPSIAARSGSRSNEITALAAAFNDIGKRLAQSEGQVRSASQTQATILEGMTESVIAVDRSERILFANGAAGRLLGLDAAQGNGSTLLEAVRSHELRTVVRQALATRRLAQAELAWRGKPPRVFDVLATPLPGEPPAGVVLVLRDISELKRLEQMRQQFVANVSHELKTPLSSIRAYTETLLSGARDDPARCERFLQQIEQQADRLQELILDMLSLARIESGQVPMKLVDLPLAPIVDRCLADFERLAIAKQVTIEKLLDAQLRASADQEAVRQILSNLIDNALKYAPRGGRVVVHTARDGDFAALAVEDNGPGIAPAHHARLFERFYRVDNARSRELGGTGLGLSIVKHLAQSMGGSVLVDSQVGAGSRFTVRLRLSTALPPG